MFFIFFNMIFQYDNLTCGTDRFSPRFAETLTLALNLSLNPNFGESGFGESGRHRQTFVLVRHL